MNQERDALSTFDFDQVTGAGLFIKFQANKPLTLRILTTDPVVSQTEFTDKATGEVNLSTRFAFTVYNFTDKKAQILQATPAMARKFGELHTDTDFGANIRNIDVKISPTGEKLERRYDVQVLPKTNELTAEMVKEAQAIDLDNTVDNGSRMSKWNQDMAGNKTEAQPASQPQSGYDKAKEQANTIKNRTENRQDDQAIETYNQTAENEHFPESEPINLDDIPF